MLETYRFKLFFSVTKFRNQNISKSILEVYFTFTVQNYIWSIAQFQQDKTNKSLHNLWSNGLVVRVQVYLTKDPRFKTIRWLKNCLSFHPSKVNLWISSVLLVCIKNTNLISQNVLQMYFFCQNNIDLKYTSSSVIQQVEVYLKYTWSIVEVYFK